MFYRLRAAYLIWRVGALDRAMRRARRAIWRLADRWPPLLDRLVEIRPRRPGAYIDPRRDDGSPKADQARRDPPGDWRGFYDERLRRLEAGLISESQARAELSEIVEPDTIVVFPSEGEAREFSRRRIIDRIVKRKGSDE